MPMLIVLIALVCCMPLAWSSQSQLYWGSTFNNLAPTENVKYDCEYNGYPTCCSLLKKETPVKKSHAQKSNAASNHQVSCNITKLYMPSHYENIHVEKALELHKIADQKNRTAQLIAFLRYDVDNTFKWLARVKEHMNTGAIHDVTEDDLKYLSRFKITKICKGAHSYVSSSWVEWIEPLTVHMRHPFAMGFCDASEVFTPEQKQRMKPPFYLQNLDHIIVQSGNDLREANVLPRHHTHVPSNNFLFDAGTSTFQSSLQWFLCAYLQRKTSFDQIYGYESTILEPIDFWQRVPKLVKSMYHFFNTPLRHDTRGDGAPLTLMQEIATEQDFVSFKLDIDTPTVEIATALEVLHNPKVTSLVDEFFFELHFRCEIMMYCGWGDEMPASYGGLKLDRFHAMRFFRDLREKGVRAHIWP